MSAATSKIFDDILARIKAAKNILIAAHRDPDGDSLGSQLALKKFVQSLNKPVTVFGDGAIPYKYEFLPGLKEIHQITPESAPESYDLAIILDCSVLSRIGAIEKLIIKGTSIIDIDHHPDNSEYGDINLILPGASSVAEILMEFFLYCKWNIDKDTATLLYTAILTDTGRFRFDSTTRRTMELAGMLLEKGISPREVADGVYHSIPPDILRMIGTVLSKTEFYENDRICIMGLDKNSMRVYHTSMGDMEGLAEYTLYGRNTLVGGLLKEQEDNTTKVSLRSRRSIDVSRLARKYGGGGHINASGCMFELPYGQTKDKLIAELKELVNGTV